MARQVHTPYVADGPFPALPYGAAAKDKAELAADVANFEAVKITGREYVYVRNSDASPHTVTFTSVADGATKRTGDVTAYSMAAGVIAIFGPFSLQGWQQSDGNLYFAASHAGMKFVVLTAAQ